MPRHAEKRQITSRLSVAWQGPAAGQPAESGSKSFEERNDRACCGLAGFGMSQYGKKWLRKVQQGLRPLDLDRKSLSWKETAAHVMAWRSESRQSNARRIKC